jgi:hypothetical protein
MPSADDWRRRWQEDYLRGATLTWRRYQALSANWEHEHCEFCWAKFLDANYSPVHAETLKSDPEVLAEGYTEAPGGSQPAGEHWICPQCFEDFRDEFGWTVVPSDPNAWPYARPEPTPRPTAADYKRSNLGDQRPANEP